MRFTIRGFPNASTATSTSASSSFSSSSSAAAACLIRLIARKTKKKCDVSRRNCQFTLSRFSAASLFEDVIRKSKPNENARERERTSASSASSTSFGLFSAKRRFFPVRRRSVPHDERIVATSLSSPLLEANAMRCRGKLCPPSRRPRRAGRETRGG